MLTVSLASCGSEKTSAPALNQLCSNGFESVDGWMGNTPTPSLTKEKAHSGAYSVLVKPGVDYSMGYENTLGKMSVSRPKKLKVTGWVFLPNPQAGARLVVEIKDPAKATDNTLMWQGIDLKREVKKFNEWQQIEKTITIPTNTDATSTFKMYLWRSDSSLPVYLDDVAVLLDNEAK